MTAPRVRAHAYPSSPAPRGAARPGVLPAARTVSADARSVNDRYKRPFDLAVIAACWLALLPFWLLLGAAIALAIRTEDGGPVLYRQPRLGRGGRIFRIVKFRTMVVGAEDRTGPVRAARRDARVTAVGRVLRRFHLDELPQVLNVLRGEMSLVGPRPERPALAARFEREAPGFSQRLRVRPGVMGLAQASGSYHWSARRKLRYDNLYIDAMGPWLDVKIGLRCVRRVLGSGRRASPPEVPPPAPAPAAARARAPCDYLLVVGPGRSGSTFLYRQLKGRTFESPTIKDAYYYRSPRRFERALRRVRTADPGAVLLDVANLAWRDPWLPAGVEALRRRGRRVLLVVLLREHRARAVSVMAFRRSRGVGGSRAGLERAAVRDSLTPDDLARLYGLGVDVVSVDFRTLVGRTGAVLDVLANRCGVPPIEAAARCGAAARGPVNATVCARNRWLSAAGKLVALALRAAGCRRWLQRLKDSPWVTGLFFRRAGAPGDRMRLGRSAADRLARRHAACRRSIEASSERLGEGIWLRRSPAPWQTTAAPPDVASAISRPRREVPVRVVRGRREEGWP